MAKSSLNIFIIILLASGVFFCLLGAIDYVTGWNKIGNGSIIPAVGVILIIVTYILAAVYKQKLKPIFSQEIIV